jgi:HSP20 family protein
MKLDELKHGLSSLKESIADGWQHLRHSASGSLTRFRPGSAANLPSQQTVDNVFYMPSLGWSMLGADLFEDEKRLIVRVEIPGMEKEDLTIDVQGDSLVVRGEKRFERKETEGQYRVLQCAYGHFRRVVPLPTPVLTDQAIATYRNGVLRLELPKAEHTKSKKMSVKVD